MLTDLERRALNAVDVPALRTFLLELLAVPSVTGTPAESELLAQLARRCDRLGLAVDHWSADLDALRADPAYPGTEADRDELWGLVATTSSADGPTVILQGHVDVVPPGEADRWSGPAFEPRVQGDRITARGACDMKAGVAANLAAVQAILATGVELPGRIALQFVASEEDGGLGAFATLQRGHRGQACIIPEPTNQRLVTANCGALTFELSVPGQAAHGSMRYAGTNPIEKFYLVLQALLQLEAERNADPDPLLSGYPVAAPLSIGRLSAGDWPSTVPDLLTAQGRYGVRLDEDPAEARRSFEQRVAEVCAADPFLRTHPVTVRWSGGQFASGRLPVGHPLRQVVGHAHADVTEKPAPAEVGAPYGSDLRLYAAQDVPTLHYGPGDPRVAHTADEYVGLAETVAVAETLVVATLRLLRNNEW